MNNNQNNQKQQNGRQIPQGYGNAQVRTNQSGNYRNVSRAYRGQTQNGVSRPVSTSVRTPSPAMQTHRQQINGTPGRTSAQKHKSASSRLSDLKMKCLWLICGTFLSTLIVLVILINIISAFAKIGKLNKTADDTSETGGNTTATDMASVTDKAADTGSNNANFAETTEPSQPEPSASTYELNFKTDLSAYEAYMNPSDNSQYLILVNTSNLLDATYAPTDLIDVVDTRSDRSARQMREYAEKSLEAFMIELRANGYTDVSVTSAYRSYSEQTSLFNGYISNYTANHPSASYEEAYAYVATFSAPPGTSEHQTGLCVDMHNLSGADVSFANQPAAVWMAENCWKFGYILRYPEDKVDVTGYSFEPWHFRYVGRDAAKVIHDGGMCLEEYIASIQ